MFSLLISNDFILNQVIMLNFIGIAYGKRSKHCIFKNEG
jgi:hypothetical protein